MLVLLAVHRVPLLKQYLNTEELTRLLKRTIKFLEDVAQPSSALAIDVKVLKSAGREAGLLPPKPETKATQAPDNAYTSFSSSTSSEMSYRTA
jgi:hypothetical protein